MGGRGGLGMSRRAGMDGSCGEDIKFCKRLLAKT